jgi:hypothetical protein
MANFTFIVKGKMSHPSRAILEHLLCEQLTQECMMDIPINIYQRHIINYYFHIKLKVLALRDPHAVGCLSKISVSEVETNQKHMHK